jgi:hypothetical protein
MKTILPLFALILFPLVLFGQQEKSFKNDSLKIPPMISDSNQNLNRSIRRDFSLYNPINSLRYTADFSSSADIISFMGKNSAMPSDFLTPLHLQYLEQQKAAPYMYILGIAQGAAVGYAAYEHIKKYGFWDKK